MTAPNTIIVDLPFDEATAIFNRQTGRWEVSGPTGKIDRAFTRFANAAYGPTWSPDGYVPDIHYAAALALAEDNRGEVKTPPIPSGLPFGTVA